jgi:high-affinity iron transporter
MNKYHIWRFNMVLMELLLMRPVRLITTCCILIAALLVVIPGLHASDLSPEASANQLRDTLFDTQKALMLGDATTAAQTFEQAQQLYFSNLAPHFNANVPALHREIVADFAAAQSAVAANDALAFAALRSRITTQLLYGAMLMTLDALRQGDVSIAQSWLLLREFRPSTRFSRPGADSTLALEAWQNGVGSPVAVADTIRVDLYDTYQALLTQALNEADTASNKGFALRRAEEAGRAAGYFTLLTTPYIEQRGLASMNAAQTAFDALVDAAITSDDVAYATAREQITVALEGFRAAPLPLAELARRAGQLTRFISLVSIEYQRGVRNGIVFNDIEVQEAVTFYTGATAAFSDIQPILAQRDAAATARVAAALKTIDEQMRAVDDPANLAATVNQINTELKTLLPPEWQTLNADSDTDVLLTLIDQIPVAVAQGGYALAESSRLEAYALFDMGLEQKLLGFAPERALAIENLFWQGTYEAPGLAALLAAQSSPAQIQATANQLKTTLREAQSFLTTHQSAPEVVVGNAGIIVFREGLEAVLILASLLASLRTVEERRYRRPIILGAALAFAATALTWWIANQMLQVLLPFGERLEAIVSLIAIGVLLVITNWFFHKMYWTGWMAGFHTQKRRIIGGGVIAISPAVSLIVLGFTSIYREGFETVLFLQSLVLEAGIATVLEGVLLGLIGVALIGFVTFKFQVRLPYKRMLVVTGIFIGVVLLTMVGNTVHVMQAVGWLPITPILGMNVPLWLGQWLGVFPTWQGIILQITAAVFVIGSYFWAEHLQSRRRERAVTRATA